METYSKDDKEGIKDRQREGHCKEACDMNSSKRLSEDILSHILRLYGSCATSHDFEIYAPDATFEDPLMCAHGIKQIKSAFYSLSKVFSESRIVEYSIKENVISPTRQEVPNLSCSLSLKIINIIQLPLLIYITFTSFSINLCKWNQILIDNKQHYKFLGKHIDMVSLIKLYVEEGKIVRHEDWWDKKPLWNRETVKLPLFGRIVEMSRRGSMLATHAMMRFGKDPTT
ncbi:hypothetical protein F0562_032155 [Nyssa sinensis]|uniref:Uncharacterized protein n=1 Tax=Nyssa sinensis TaxID=561372 RepID=A0A5J5AXM8_9ASTE|nr:hypothetical protein F0562_032155 [Nyssa sinensis]